MNDYEAEAREAVAAALAGERNAARARWLWHLALSVDGLARGRPLAWRDGANCLLWCSLLAPAGASGGLAARKAAAAARRLVAAVAGGLCGLPAGALQKQCSVPQTPPPGGVAPEEALRAEAAVARAAARFLAAVADLEERGGGRAEGAAAVAAAFAAICGPSRSGRAGGAAAAAAACAFAVEAATGWRRALQDLAGLAFRIPPGRREAGGDLPRALAVAEAALRAAGEEAGGLWAAALEKIEGRGGGGGGGEAAAFWRAGAGRRGLVRRGRGRRRRRARRGRGRGPA